jgi:hypothetical protein
MGDDQITIDPEFRPPSRSSEDQGRRLKRLAAVAAVAMAFVFGWLVASPTTTESDGTDGAASTSTTVIPEVTSTSATEPGAFAGLDVPLGEEVPGFTDTVVMLATPPSSFDVVRWRASSPTTEVMLSLDRDEVGWGSGRPAGLDVSGGWFAESFDDGLLVVHEANGEPANPEGVGLRAASLV